MRKRQHSAKRPLSAPATCPAPSIRAFLRPISDKMPCDSLNLFEALQFSSSLAGGCASPHCSYETGDGGLFHLAWPAISSFPKATLGCPVPGIAFAFVVVKLPHLLSTNGVAVNSVAGVVWRHEQDSELTWRPIRSRIRVPLLRKPLGGGGRLRA